MTGPAASASSTPAGPLRGAGTKGYFGGVVRVLGFDLSSLLRKALLCGRVARGTWG
jgi:hypothetical protein